MKSASEAQREKGQGSGHGQAGLAEADHLKFRWHDSGIVVWWDMIGVTNCFLIGFEDHSAIDKLCLVV